MDGDWDSPNLVAVIELAARNQDMADKHAAGTLISALSAASLTRPAPIRNGAPPEHPGPLRSRKRILPPPGSIPE